MATYDLFIVYDEEVVEVFIEGGFRFKKWMDRIYPSFEEAKQRVEQKIENDRKEWNSNPNPDPDRVCKDSLFDQGLYFYKIEARRFDEDLFDDRYAEIYRIGKDWKTKELKVMDKSNELTTPILK